MGVKMKVRGLMAYVLALLITTGIVPVSIVSAQNPEESYIKDSFDDITQTQELWQTSKNKVTVTTGKTGNGIKIPTVVASENTAVRASDIILEGNRVVLSFNVSTTANFDVGIKSETGELKKIIAVNKVNENVDYYTHDTMEKNAGDTYCRYIENYEGWETVKLSLDYDEKTVEVNTQNGGFKVLDYELPEKVSGFFISTQKAIGKATVIDNFYVREENQNNGFLIDYSMGDFGAQGATGGTVAQSKDGLLKLYALYDKGDGTKGTSYNNGIVSINIDQNLHPLHENGNFYITVEYLDEGYGWFYIEYPGLYETKKSEYFSLRNTGKYLKKEIVLTQAAFGKTGVGYDFRICTTEDMKNYSDYSALKTSTEPVYIKSVSGYSEDTCSPIKAEITTKNPGNIFFGDEKAEFDVVLENKSQESSEFTANFLVYIIDDNMQEVLVDTVEKEYSMDQNEKFTDRVTIPANRFGVYVLRTEFSGKTGEKAIKQSEKTEFSRCVENETADYRIGVCTSMSRDIMGGDPDMGMKLMRKAGMGLVREDFEWGNYEKPDHTYGLTPAKAEFLKAAGENDMEVLAILDTVRTGYSTDDWSGLVPEADLEPYKNHLRSMLNEPLFSENVSMIEVWNEPDAERTSGGNVIFEDKSANNKELNKIRGKIYADMVKAVYDVVEEAGHDYKIGAFSLCKWYDNSYGFVDEVLNNFQGEKYFDALTYHAYIGPDDPEPGNFGKPTTEPFHFSSYRLNYYPALLTGEPLYNPVTGASAVLSGLCTNNVYNYELNEPTWITEGGYSSAYNSEWGMAVKDEYHQGERIVRFLNEIRTNSCNDKVWLYRFDDTGIGEGRTETNYGLVNPWQSEIPYSAKPAFLMVSNMNKLIEGYYEVNRVYENDYAFISEYKTPKRTVYMLSATKEGGKTVEYDFGDTVRYYDIYGNKLSEDEVLTDGKYNLSEKPFYAVTGEDIDFPELEKESITISLSDEDKTVLELIKDGFGVNLVFENYKKDTDYTVVCGIYKENRLISLKYIGDKITKPSSVIYKSYKDVISKGEIKDADEIRIFLFDGFLKATPLTESFVKEERSD